MTYTPLLVASIENRAWKHSKTKKTSVPTPAKTKETILTDNATVAAAADKIDHLVEALDDAEGFTVATHVERGTTDLRAEEASAHRTSDGAARLRKRHWGILHTINMYAAIAQQSDGSLSLTA